MRVRKANSVVLSGEGLFLQLRVLNQSLMRTLTALVVKVSGRIRDTVGENRFYILLFPFHLLFSRPLLVQI